MLKKEVKRVVTENEAYKTFKEIFWNWKNGLSTQQKSKLQKLNEKANNLFEFVQSNNDPAKPNRLKALKKFIEDCNKQIEAV